MGLEERLDLQTIIKHIDVCVITPSSQCGYTTHSSFLQLSEEESLCFLKHATRSLRIVVVVCVCKSMPRSENEETAALYRVSTPRKQQAAVGLYKLLHLDPVSYCCFTIFWLRSKFRDGFISLIQFAQNETNDRQSSCHQITDRSRNKTKSCGEILALPES